ncbi:hypothetical protein QUF90_24305 [Desulfococcaceae bacterium HSG9]|nr:hypothetical protein [Desulfococcaceae bacterium HSG9]
MQIIFDHYYDLIKSSIAGKALYSIIVGVVGVLILAVFFTVPVRVASLSFLMPWFMAFNCALTGYMLLEKTLDRLKYKRTFAVGAGVAVVVLVCASMFFILPAVIDTSQITVNDLLLWFIIGAVFSWLGGILAIKYDNLKRKGGIAS